MGLKTVIIPKDNVPDLEEIDPLVRAQLTFVPVEMIDEVLAEALPLTAPRGKGKQSSNARCRANAKKSRVHPFDSNRPEKRRKGVELQ